MPYIKSVSPQEGGSVAVQSSIDENTQSVESDENEENQVVGSNVETQVVDSNEENTQVAERTDENVAEKTPVVDSNDGKTQVEDSNEENTQVAETKDENLVVDMHINPENTPVVDSNDGKTQVVDSNEENTQVAERKDENLVVADNEENIQEEAVPKQDIGPRRTSSRRAAAATEKNRPRCNITGMNCPNKPLYGFFGATEPTRCKEHKEPGMVPKNKMSPTKAARSTPKRKAAAPLEGSACRIQQGKKQLLISENPHTPSEPKESEEDDEAREKKVSRKSPTPDVEGGLRGMLQLTEESSPSESKPKKVKCIKPNCTRKATFACTDNDDETPVFCDIHGKDLHNTYKPDVGILH